MADRVPHQQVGSLCGTGEQEGKDAKLSPPPQHHGVPEGSSSQPGPWGALISCAKLAHPAYAPGMARSSPVSL